MTPGGRHSVDQQAQGSKTGPQLSGIEPAQFGRDGLHILFDAACIERPPAEFFEPDHWRARDAVLGMSRGRGAACLFRYRDKTFVLRHYRRGGLVARLSDDRYSWVGLERTRAWREWHLLAAMYAQGLPVPRPVAARVRRRGPFYRADLVTLCLPGVTPLAEILQRQALPEARWRGIGAVIGRFHRAGVWHADLNARNILLDEAGGVFLIDFDKSERRAPSARWQRANLGRLQRSLNKFKRHETEFHFEEPAWRWLLAGYDNHGASASR